MYGPLFHGIELRRLTIIDTPLQSIEKDTFWGVNATLQQIDLIRTELVFIDLSKYCQEYNQYLLCLFLLLFKGGTPC